ncbi:hypothetical protein GIB67_002654 [Kingdonia uniflora]|uniref:Uncharacterized protein n=1 Tax=Kingdonia uniflora TaxID=39325 RepID=A0A7J7LJT0_9MAGN|nr:hypothetical protein GIB67_002654 [Kingdonia uniflora]
MIIAFCETDIGITAKIKGKQSIGYLFWLLAKMASQMRDTILLGQKWDVMVDLFFCREPRETKRKEEEAHTAQPATVAVEAAGNGWDDVPIPLIAT